MANAIDFFLNGVFIAELFGANGTDCLFPPDYQQVTLDLATYNALVAGGDVLIDLTTDDFGTRDCLRSIIRIETEIPAVPFNDLNENGILDVCERPADLNLDGVVNVDDLLALLGGWGVCPIPPQACPADLDTDGAVSVFDLLQLLADWD